MRAGLAASTFQRWKLGKLYSFKSFNQRPRLEHPAKGSSLKMSMPNAVICSKTGRFLESTWEKLARGFGRQKISTEKERTVVKNHDAERKTMRRWVSSENLHDFASLGIHQLLTGCTKNREEKRQRKRKGHLIHVCSTLQVYSEICMYVYIYQHIHRSTGSAYADRLAL